MTSSSVRSSATLFFAPAHSLQRLWVSHHRDRARLVERRVQRPGRGLVPAATNSSRDSDRARPRLVRRRETLCGKLLRRPTQWQKRRPLS